MLQLKSLLFNRVVPCHCRCEAVRLKTWLRDWYGASPSVQLSQCPNVPMSAGLTYLYFLTQISAGCTKNKPATALTSHFGRIRDQHSTKVKIASKKNSRLISSLSAQSIVRVTAR